MLQVNEAIKKDIITHAARKIEVTYEPGKTVMTQQDGELLDAYTRLHDFEFEMLQTANKLYHESVPAGKKIDMLHGELSKAKIAFNECCQLADKLSAMSYDRDETNLKKLAKCQEQTGEELIAYSDSLQEVYETVKELSEKVNKYHEENEDVANALYEKFSAIRTAHSVNWQDNAINIVAFEDEYDRFYSYRTVSEERRESLMDFCNKTLNSYSTLNLQTTALYDVWKEFLKRSDLLKVVAGLHSQQTGFTNN